MINILLIARVEAADRKSFFAMAESPNGIDNFHFWDYPVNMPETNIPILIFMICVWCSMKMDGYMVYFVQKEGILQHLPADQSAAIAQCGIARTKDLMTLGTIE